MPLTALLPEAADWVLLQDGVIGPVFLLELLVALAVVGAAVIVGIRERRWEVVAVVAGLLLILSASRSVWDGPAHLRYAGPGGHRLVRAAQPGPAPARGDEPRQRATGRRDELLVLRLAAAALASSYLVRTP